MNIHDEGSTVDGWNLVVKKSDRELSISFASLRLSHRRPVRSDRARGTSVCFNSCQEFRVRSATQMIECRAGIRGSSIERGLDASSVSVQFVESIMPGGSLSCVVEVPEEIYSGSDTWKLKLWSELNLC